MNDVKCCKDLEWIALHRIKWVKGRAILFSVTWTPLRLKAFKNLYRRLKHNILLLNLTSVTLAPWDNHKFALARVFYCHPDTTMHLNYKPADFSLQKRKIAQFSRALQTSRSRYLNLTQHLQLELHFWLKDESGAFMRKSVIYFFFSLIFSTNNFSCKFKRVDLECYCPGQASTFFIFDELI